MSNVAMVVVWVAMIPVWLAVLAYLNAKREYGFDSDHVALLAVGAVLWPVAIPLYLIMEFLSAAEKFAKVTAGALRKPRDKE